MSIFSDVFLIIFYFSFFAFLHSILASLKLKQFLREKIGDRIAFYRLSYNIFSLVSFGLFLYLSPKPQQLVYEIPFPYDFVIYFFQILSLMGIVWTFKYIDFGEFIGLKQIKRYLSGNYQDIYDENFSFRVLGPYRISRHPVYLFSILFLSLRPYMTVFYLTLIVLVILYFYIGSYFEEQKLETLFGEEYRNYKSQVSRIFPIKFLVKGLL